MSKVKNKPFYQPKRKNEVQAVTNRFGLPEKKFIRKIIDKDKKDVRVDLSFNNFGAVILRCFLISCNKFIIRTMNLQQKYCNS